MATYAEVEIATGGISVEAGDKQVLLLWDVDHTLIENSGVSKAVYAEAFRHN